MKHLFFILFSLLIISCSKKSDPDVFIGKWQVVDSGINGLEIFYEFTPKKILIESKFSKFLADSLGEKNNLIEEEYIIKSSDSVFVLEAKNIFTNVVGEYRILVDTLKIFLTNPQGEILELKKLNQNIN